MYVAFDCKFLSCHVRVYAFTGLLTAQVSHLAVWLNRWVLVYELSGCRFESRCIHLSIVVCHNAVLVGKWSAAWSDIPIEANNHIFYISLKVKLKAIIKIRGQDHPPKFSFSLKNIFYEFVKFAFVLCKQVTKMSSFFCFWHCFI